MNITNSGVTVFNAVSALQQELTALDTPQAVAEQLSYKLWSPEVLDIFTQACWFTKYWEDLDSMPSGQWSEYRLEIPQAIWLHSNMSLLELDVTSTYFWLVDIHKCVPTAANIDSWVKHFEDLESGARVLRMGIKALAEGYMRIHRAWTNIASEELYERLVSAGYEIEPVDEFVKQKMAEIECDGADADDTSMETELN